MNKYPLIFLSIFLLIGCSSGNDNSYPETFEKTFKCNSDSNDLVFSFGESGVFIIASLSSDNYSTGTYIQEDGYVYKLLFPDDSIGYVAVRENMIYLLDDGITTMSQADKITPNFTCAATK